MPRRQAEHGQAERHHAVVVDDHTLSAPTSRAERGWPAAAFAATLSSKIGQDRSTVRIGDLVSEIFNGGQFGVRTLEEARA